MFENLNWKGIFNLGGSALAAGIVAGLLAWCPDFLAPVFLSLGTVCTPTPGATLKIIAVVALVAAWAHLRKAVTLLKPPAPPTAPPAPPDPPAPPA